MDRKRTADNQGPRQPPPALRGELGALADRYNVDWDAEAQAVILADVELPDGFTPRHITMEIEVLTAFPRSPPRVVLPWHMRLHGRVPRPMLVSGRFLVRGTLGDPIIFWPAWEQSNTLRDVVEQVLTELATMSETYTAAVEDNANESAPTARDDWTRYAGSKNG